MADTCEILQIGTGVGEGVARGHYEIEGNCRYVWHGRSQWYLQRQYEIIETNKVLAPHAVAQRIPPASGNSEFNTWFNNHMDGLGTAGLLGRPALFEASLSTQLYQYKFREKVSRKNTTWAVLKRQGTIVVTPMRQGEVTIANRMFFVGGSVSTVQKWLAVQTVLPVATSKCGSSNVFHWPDGVKTLYAPSYGGTQSALRYTVRVRRDGTPVELFERYPQVPTKDWCRKLIGELDALPVSTELATEAVAELNSGVLDVLTNMAELFKETAGQVYSGVTRVLQMSGEALRLSRSMLKKQKVRGSLRRNSSRFPGLEFKLSKGTISSRDLKRIRRTLPSDDPLQALVTVWMTYRYGIMPLSYAVDDLLSYLSKTPTYVSVRKRQDREVTIYVDGWTMTVPVIERIFAKARIDPQASASGLKTNPFATAWELIPLSFVWDWFINVGDLLSTIYGPHGATQVVYGRSLKVDAEVTASHTSGDTTVVRVKYYTYQNIDAEQHVGLCFRPSLSDNRVKDALALGYSLVKSTFLNKTRTPR